MGLCPTYYSLPHFFKLNNISSWYFYVSTPRSTSFWWKKYCPFRGVSSWKGAPLLLLLSRETGGTHLEEMLWNDLIHIWKYTPKVLKEPQFYKLAWEESLETPWKRNILNWFLSINYKLALAMGACHLPLQGLNQVLLQLLTFDTPWKESRVDSRNEALCTGRWGVGGKLAEQAFRQFQEWIYEPNSCISSYLEKH